MDLFLSNKVVKKILDKRKDTIRAIEKEISVLRTQLLKLVQKHLLWNSCLKDIKGVGPVTAAGIIGSVRRFSRFPNFSSIRHFAGMITKSGNPSYNRHLKQALHNFVEGIIRKRTPFWRELYDKKKLYYREKHPNWKLCKVDAYAKKRVQTRFLYRVWIKGIETEN